MTQGVGHHRAGHRTDDRAEHSAEDKAAGGLQNVWHYCPGGRENGGGIGRMIGYIQDAGQTGKLRHGIIDTRGPGWRWLASPFLLGRAAAIMARSRLTEPGSIHHIHVAGRGSTVRKLILTRLARALGAVHVLHLHDYDYATDVKRRPAWQRKQIAAMFRGAYRVVVLGAKDRDFMIGQLGVREDRVVVLPNSVPDPLPGAPHHANSRTPVLGLHYDAPPEHPPEHPLRILFLGRLSARKGVPELLSALSRPALADLAWEAVLAGDGPVDGYRKVASDLGLVARVTMPGWLAEHEVRALCATADILVLPSHAEGLAMAVLEGLSHGLAVVTTRVGAHDEVIVEGVNGLFVPVGDVDALATALRALLCDPDLRHRLARGGRATFAERFEIGGYMRRLTGIYGGLLPVADRTKGP